LPALIAGNKPKAGGDLCRVEELAGQRDHAVHEIGFDDVFADFAFAGLVRRHRAVGEDEAGKTHGREVVDDVLHPSEVSVADGWAAILPPLVVAQQFAAPVADVERRIGEDVVGLEVRVSIIVKRIAMSDLPVDAADGEVHLSEPPGSVIGLLAVNADVRFRLASLP